MASAKEFLIKLFLESDTKGGDKALTSLKSIRTSLDKTAAVGTKMSLMLTAPLVAFAATSIKAVADFEEQMAKVGAVSQATQSELEALENQARKLGATTKFSATQAAEAMAFLSMAGFNARQTMAAMPSTLKLASAASLDMGTAADITSNILTGFAMEISELGHVNDVLVKATTSSNTNLTQLGEAMKYVAPTAAGAGQSIEEITAALGALGNAGIQGGMAGTTLRGVLSELLNPSTATAKILKDLGVNVRTSTGAMRPLISILEDLSESGIQTSQVMEIFGDRAGPGMVALIEQGSDSLTRFSQALKNSEGTADKVASDLENSLGGAWRELQSAYQELQITLMQAGVFDALKSLIGVAKNLVNSFASLDEGTKKYAIAVAALVAALGPTIFLTSKLLSGFSLLGTGIAMTTKYGIGYEEALGNLKALDDLENKRSKKNQKSESKDAVYGKTVSQIEKEQAKVQKLLNSNSFSQIERGQKQAQSFEDKYGITVNDSARNYKGRDRKTGKLIAPQVGKEFEEIQALEALKENPQKNLTFKKKSFARAEDLGAQTVAQGEDLATVVNDTQPTQFTPATPQQVAPTQPAQNTPQASQNNGNAGDKNNAGLLEALKVLATQIIETNKILKDNQSLLKDIKNAVGADYI